MNREKRLALAKILHGFISYGSCRQANAAERRMLAEDFRRRSANARLALNWTNLALPSDETLLCLLAAALGEEPETSPVAQLDD